MPTANRGYAEIEIRGEKKLMRFDFNAIADLEEYYGKGFTAIMSEEAVGFSTIRALYWAGLKWKIKGLTIAQAGAICREKIEGGEDLQDLFKAPMKALKNSGMLNSKKTDSEGEPDILENVLNNSDDDEENDVKN